jgi:acylphosphatase
MAGEPASKTVRLRIYGRVQGVGYRAWTAQKARKLGLVGWVRNLTDGTVECMAQGPREAIEALVAACHAGPPIARVTQVDTGDVAEAEVYTSFRQCPTADPEE